MGKKKIVLGVFLLVIISVVAYFLTKDTDLNTRNELPDITEGPIIEKETDRLIVRYLRHDSEKDTSYVHINEYRLDIDTIKPINIDSETYVLKENSRDSSSYSNVEKIFVLGDVHGKYDRMVKNLKSNGIIDQDLHWNWGNGHLVFVGDIMDRGDKVTESLWLIYHLEQEAEKAGGKVHLLLGNHEMMVFREDLRYINWKYELICNDVGISYSDMFGKNTVLGSWLRSKNAITKINDVIFVHAGISSDLANKDYSLDEINANIFEYLNGNGVSDKKEIYKFLLGSKGPTWYRGYFKESKRYPKMEQEELTAILKQYKASTIVVGHTETDTLKSFLNGAIIDLNIPLKKDEIPNQALLIESGHFYRLEEGKNPIMIE
jgi:predicted phosphodiesterase